MSLPRSNVAPGDRLGAYILEEPIARGGMAVVWRARHARSGLITAVKTLSPELASDPLFEAMLREESRIASRIDHPNVARVLGWGEEEGIPYLATEWVDGVSAHALHRAVVKAGGRPMPSPVALRIAIDACAGLHAAHMLRDENGASSELVHRDVSPPNIMIGRDGVTRLIDFGIARVRARAIAPTAAEMVKGKVPFMAPEQAFGALVDARTDVWAMGATLYYLLSGELPIAAPDDQVRLHLLASGAEPTPLPSHVPTAIAEVVARALRLERTDRFSSAEAMRVALVEAGPAATGSDMSAFVRSYAPPVKRLVRRWPVAVASGAFVFVVATLSLASARARTKPLPPAVAVMESVATQAPAVASPPASSVPIPSPSPRRSGPASREKPVASQRSDPSLPPYGNGKRDYGF